MGIWIRSQDGKKLVEAKCININNDLNIMADCGVSDSGFYMGLYPTEAQAKSVLDEIEVYIRESEFLRRNRTGGYQDTVYHMPPAEQEG